MAIRSATPGRGYQQAPALTMEQWLAEQERMGNYSYSRAPMSVSAQQAQRAPSTSGIASTVAQKGVSELLKGDTLSNIFGSSSTPAATTTAAAPTAVGSAANGGTMMSDGSIMGGSEGGLSFGNVAGTIAALKGGYDTINGLQHGGEGLRGGLTTAGAGVGQLIGGPLGAGAGALLGNIAGYGLQGDGWKNKLALTAVLPPLGIAKMLGFNPIHKTTRQVAQEHTADLQKQFKDDSTYQAYVRGMREQYNAPPPDPTKPFAGKYATWDEYKKGGLEAGDLTGVYGNLKTFGQDWSNIDQAKRQAVTQGLIDAGLYNSKKGEVEITDSAKARQIYDQIVKGSGYKPPTTTTAGGVSAGRGPTQNPDPGRIVSGAPVPSPTMIPRSKTKSPGIGLDGKRLKAVGGRL